MTQPAPAVPHTSLAELFAKVAVQLDLLQPPSIDAASRVRVPEEERLLPSRERVHELLRDNVRFRPAEELHRRRPPAPAPLRRDSTAAPLRRDSLEHSSSPSTPAGDAPPPQALFVPVGGRARVFQAPDLARAKRSLQRKSLALTHAPASSSSPSASSSAAVAKRGDAQGSGKQALIAELVRATAFSTQHIFHMSRKFKEIAGASKSVITFAEFRQILSDDVTALLAAGGDPPPPPPSSKAEGEEGTAGDVDMREISASIAASESFLRRLFQMFDGDGDGKIDFREFVVGLNAFASGSIEDKVDGLFAVYQSGAVPHTEELPSPSSPVEPTVAISDLLGLFQGDRQLYQELMRCVDEYFARAPCVPSASGGGAGGGEEEEATSIAAADFVAASLSEPSLLETISRPTSSLAYSEDALLREQLKAFVDRRGVRWPTLLALLRRALAVSASPPPRTSISDLQVPIASALSLLSECLAPVDRAEGEEPEDGGGEEEQLNRLLRRYMAKSAAGERPSTSSALLQWLEFLQDLTVVLLHPSASGLVEPGEAEAKARYYFELFDLDGDGLLSRHELVSAVCHGFAHFGPHLTEVVRVLEGEDVDTDGHLTKTQYLRAARRSSLILASLYTCL